MIEYNVRNHTCNGDGQGWVRINFGKYEEHLMYDKGTGVFSICDSGSHEEVVIILEDIPYLIHALEKLKEISKDDKIND